MSEVVLKPGPSTCNPEVPTHKCADRRAAEASGTMYWNEQARGWVYPRPARLRVPIETWAFCPFCLIPLPDDEVPALARRRPYCPPPQPDTPR